MFEVLFYMFCFLFFFSLLSSSYFVFIKYLFFMIILISLILVLSVCIFTLEFFDILFLLLLMYFSVWVLDWFLLFSFLCCGCFLMFLYFFTKSIIFMMVLLSLLVLMIFSDPGKKGDKVFYVSVLDLSVSASSSFMFFNSVSNSAFVKGSSEDKDNMGEEFSELYCMGNLSVKKICFFNYVFGKIVYSNICSIKGVNFVSESYFLEYFNKYVLNLFFEQSLKNTYFCDGVVLEASVDFWLSKLDSNGVFKDSFLSYCNSNPNKIFYSTSCYLFVTYFDVFETNPVEVGSELLDHDISVVKDMSLSDDKCVEDYISFNSKSLCSEFYMSESMFLSLKHFYSSGDGFENFLSNGGTF